MPSHSEKEISGIHFEYYFEHPALTKFAYIRYLTRENRVKFYASAGEKAQVIKPINGDPFIGMLETPVTSAPIVSNFLSNLPAYRTGVSPLLRGVEVGLAHGFFCGWSLHQTWSTSYD